MARKKSLALALFFAGVFVLLCFELVSDERTYMNPPSYSEAESSVGFWLSMAKPDHAQDPSSQVKKKELAEYMSSDGRYMIHRAFNLLILGGYLISAMLIWKRYAAALTAVAFTFGLKIAHGIFFIWMGYHGRKASADLIGAAPPPLVVFNSNEKYYLGGIALSVLILLYFYLLKKKQRRKAVVLRF